MSTPTDLIKAIPLFSSLSRKQLGVLAAASAIRPAEANSVIVHQDEPGTSCFLVLAGRVQIRRNNHNVAVRGEGDVIGELALLDGGPRLATVSMITRGELLEVGRDGFVKLLDSSPELARMVMLQLADRLRATTIASFE